MRITGGGASSVQLDPKDPTKTTRIGMILSSELNEVLVKFLKDNSDIFKLSHKDMPGISLEMMVHKLNVDPTFRPIKQKKRTFNPERYEATKKEVEKLLKAGLIKEVIYPT